MLLIRNWSAPLLRATCRPASSLLRYRADPRIYSAVVNFPVLAHWQIGSGGYGGSWLELQGAVTIAKDRGDSSPDSRVC